MVGAIKLWCMVQVWLTLHNLVADPACRGKLAVLRSESGREALLSLRPRLTEPLLDQLPPLGALQRALNELALGALPTAPGNEPPARLIIEQVRFILQRCEPEVSELCEPACRKTTTDHDGRLNIGIELLMMRTAHH